MQLTTLLARRGYRGCVNAPRRNSWQEVLTHCALAMAHELICESDVARKRQDTVVRRPTPRTLARGALECRGEQGVDKRSLAARR